MTLGALNPPGIKSTQKEKEPHLVKLSGITTVRQTDEYHMGKGLAGRG